MPAKTKTTQDRTPPLVFHLHLTLAEICPVIWRKLQVPATMKLSELHGVLQIVMGWTDSHLHGFRVEERYFSDPSFELDDDSFGEEVGDERKMRLGQFVSGEGFAFTYEYDFGDSWRHHLIVEKSAAPEAHLILPVCTSGARACPPEDVGGVHGYAEFLDILKHKGHEEHLRMLTWVGGVFDPEGFDINTTNRRLHMTRNFARRY